MAIRSVPTLRISPGGCSRQSAGEANQEAQFQNAQLHEFGVSDVARDFVRALVWYETAESNGHPRGTRMGPNRGGSGIWRSGQRIGFSPGIKGQWQTRTGKMAQYTELGCI